MLVKSSEYSGGHGVHDGIGASWTASSGVLGFSSRMYMKQGRISLGRKPRRHMHLGWDDAALY
jgi:hypothetical protein